MISKISLVAHRLLFTITGVNAAALSRLEVNSPATDDGTYTYDAASPFAAPTATVANSPICCLRIVSEDYDDCYR